MAWTNLQKVVMDSWPALRSRNFRLFIGGQTVSLVGTFMQQVAMSWLVYRLTRSTVALGSVAFAMDISGVAVALFSGLLADRFDPRRIILTTQSLAMIQALLLAALVFTGRINITAVVLLSCWLGIVSGFDVPARQVFVLQLVERREDLGNAIVLTSLALDSARLVGPSVGGAVIASVGEWLCFLLNAISFCAVIAALLAIKASSPRQAKVTGTAARMLIEGIRYASGFEPIRYVLMLVALVSFAGGWYAVLMPVMAERILHGGPYTLGLLMASSGLGALAGAMLLGRRKILSGYDRFAGVGAGLFGLSLLMFAFSRWLFVSVPLLIIAGFGIMILMNSSHTILLTMADPEKRGRVMSLFTLSFMATAPFGSLLAGTVAKITGTPAVFAIGGGLCTIAASIFLSKVARLRRIDQEVRSLTMDASCVTTDIASGEVRTL